MGLVCVYYWTTTPCTSVATHWKLVPKSKASVRRDQESDLEGRAERAMGASESLCATDCGDRDDYNSQYQAKCVQANVSQVYVLVCRAHRVPALRCAWRQGGALRERRHGRMRDHAVAAACSGGQEHICLHVFCDFLCPTGVLCCCLLPRAPHSGYGDTACPPRQVRRKNGVPALQPGTLSSLCTTLHRHASLLKSKLSNANSTR